MIKHHIKKFFQLEASTGIILIVATFFAMMIANSKDSDFYFLFLSLEVPIKIDFIAYSKELSLRDWVNDGLMAVFFFLIGLELKKEVLEGDLSSKAKISLPAIAAIGGIILPALIFYLFNHNKPSYLKGFAVPTATDIAFAYGMLCLFGKRITTSAKIFLVALAVLDDLAAILIIALFYTKEINVAFLLLSSFSFIGLILLNRYGCRKVWPYLLCGLFLWLAILKSGVHATIAGVLMAMFIPLRVGNTPILEYIDRRLSPSVNFLILPVFAFVNAGVRIEDFDISILYKDSIILGIILGLFIGKQFGVILLSYLAVRFKFASLPRGTSWGEFYGVAIFTGIGFTMSLFIGSLAFSDSPLVFDKVKIAVLFGSILSLTYGSIIILTDSALQKYRKRVIKYDDQELKKY